MISTDPAIDIAVSLDALAGSMNLIRKFAPANVLRGVFYDATGSEIEGDPTELFIRALSSWDTVDESKDGTVIRFPGLVEITPKLLGLILDFNAKKTALEQTAEAWKKHPSMPQTGRQMRAHYDKAGYRRIHPLQAWRKVVHVPSTSGDNQDALSSIGFTIQQRGYSSQVLTLDQATAKLIEANAYDLLDRLEADAVPKDSKFRWCEPVQPHIRANAVWGSGANAARDQYHASMPLCVLEGFWPTKRVRYNPPKKTEHSVRSDSFSENPRYLLPFRSGAYLQRI